MELPSQPAGVEVLAAVAHARRHRPPDFGDPKVTDPRTRQHAWDAGIESSCIAVHAYLWRRGRSEKWAGRHGSARFACSIEQIVCGLAPIMAWGNVPEPRERSRRRRFVRAHRRSVQRWLDWLQAAALVSHQPCRDAEGFWWRTLITLHPVPEMAAEHLQAAVDRRAGWCERERQRQRRGERRVRHGQRRARRNLDAILRRARLSSTERRARAQARRHLLAEHAQRVRVRELIQMSLFEQLAHPCGAEAMPQGVNTVGSKEDLNRRHALANDQTHCATQNEANPLKAATETRRREASGHPAAIQADRGASGGLHSRSKNIALGPGDPRRGFSSSFDAPAGQAVRDAVYNEVASQRWYQGHRPQDPAAQLERMRGADRRWEPAVRRQARRVEALRAWGPSSPGPDRWRILEAWAVASHGPQMTAAGGFRLAFFNEAQHGPRLDRALNRFARYAELAAPTGWPMAPVAALIRWIDEEVVAQDGPEHGMAIDIARFDAFTKDMAAYAHHRDPRHLERAAARARRRQQLQAAAQEITARLGFRKESGGPALQTARELLASDYIPHRRQGQTLYARLTVEQRRETRDEALIAGRHPGDSDARYDRARRHAGRWGLAPPSGTWKH